MTTVAGKLGLSHIAPSIVQSEIRAMSVECDRVGGVNLAQGICDTDIPGPVPDAAKQAIDDGFNIYTRLDGIPSLRSAISEKLASFNGIHADPDTEILVTNGATGALYTTLLALLNPGDEVVVFEPFYGYHVNTLLSLRMVPAIVGLETPEWLLDREALEATITERTRALILNTPSNPSGKLFSRAELQQIAEVAIAHDLLVITDEIYEYFIYDRREHVSIATLPGMRERTVTISGLSKTFSITGWRVGYLTAPVAFLPAIGYFHDLVYICSPAPLQHAVAAGLQALAGSGFYEELARTHERKRDRLCAALQDAGFHAPKPDGAYYILAGAEHLPVTTASERARYLLRETGVAAVAGSAFFRKGQGESTLRFCFGKREHDLDRACEALRGLR